MTRYQYSALIQSPTNSILSIWMSWWVSARSPRRSMENIVALLRSGCDWALRQAYGAGFRQFAGRNVDEVVLRRIQILESRKFRIEVAHGDPQVPGLARI